MEMMIFLLYTSVYMFRSFPGFAIETSSGIITIPYPIHNTVYICMLYGFNYNIQVPGKIGVYKRGKNKDKLTAL